MIFKMEMTPGKSLILPKLSLEVCMNIHESHIFSVTFIKSKIWGSLMENTLALFLATSSQRERGS